MKMIHEYSDEAEESLGGFSEQQIVESGYEHAKGIPRNNMECISESMSEGEAEDKAMAEWAEAEDNSRQFSPFEFTAKILNDMEDSERGWMLFEDGIALAFRQGWDWALRQYTFKG